MSGSQCINHKLSKNWSCLLRTLQCKTKKLENVVFCTSPWKLSCHGICLETPQLSWSYTIHDLSRKTFSSCSFLFFIVYFYRWISFVGPHNFYSGTSFIRPHNLSKKATHPKLCSMQWTQRKMSPIFVRKREEPARGNDRKWGVLRYFIHVFCRRLWFGTAPRTLTDIVYKEKVTVLRGSKLQQAYSRGDCHSSANGTVSSSL